MSGDQERQHHHGYVSDAAAYQRRLRRIEGQVRGVQKMIDEERYCIDILTQISAVRAGLASVAQGLMEDHLRHCVLGLGEEGRAESGCAGECCASEGGAAERCAGERCGGDEGPSREQMLEEIMAAIARL